MTFTADQLRTELLPSSQLEELYFDAIVRLATCAHYLGRHIESDPELALPETTRRMRLLLTTESKLRSALEEFRRLKIARQLQLHDSVQAARPLLAVVATHTTRNGFRMPPRSQTVWTSAVGRQVRELELDDARVDAHMAALFAKKLETYHRPPTPGRNAACPCNSGRKYKHCCANKQAAAA